MSRSKAHKELSIDEVVSQMRGVFSTSVNMRTLDEAPMAYKPVQLIQNAIEPTVRIIDCIKPLMNLNDSGRG